MIIINPTAIPTQILPMKMRMRSFLLKPLKVVWSIQVKVISNQSLTQALQRAPRKALERVAVKALGEGLRLKKRKRRMRRKKRRRRKRRKKRKRRKRRKKRKWRNEMSRKMSFDGATS